MSKFKAKIILGMSCVILTVIVAAAACMKKIYDYPPTIFIVISVVSCFLLSVEGLVVLMYCKSVEVMVQPDDVAIKCGGTREYETSESHAVRVHSEDKVSAIIGDIQAGEDSVMSDSIIKERGR